MSQPPTGSPRSDGGSVDQPTAELPAHLSPQVPRRDDDDSPLPLTSRPPSANRTPWIVVGAVVLIAALAATVIVLVLGNGTSSQPDASGGQSQSSATDSSATSSPASGQSSSSEPSSKSGFPSPSGASSSQTTDLQQASAAAQTFLDLVSAGKSSYQAASMYVCAKDRASFLQSSKSGKYAKLNGKTIKAGSAKSAGSSTATVSFSYPGGGGTLHLSAHGGTWSVCPSDQSGGEL